jgi:hypothetical protein
MVGSRVNNPAWWDPPEDPNCGECWEFRGHKFKCDLWADHPGAHISYPKNEKETAIIIWSDSGGD